MADILTTDDVTTERISNIIHQHLAERFSGEISFGPVLPVIRTDYQEGLDYLQIYIVFDGDQDGLDPRWTVRLPARIRPQLAELGYASMPITSWVHSSEWEGPLQRRRSMNWNDLIAIARVLAAGALPPLTGRPRRAELSRADQHHLLRRVPRPGQQQRQHPDRLKHSGPQRPRMDADLPRHRSPVSASALPAPRHAPLSR